MLHLIPAPLHRALYRVADRVRRAWWRVRRPDQHSAVVVAFGDDGRVLLVRHSYGRPVWTVPGGGLARGEDPAEGAAREVREELGCALGPLVPLGPRQVDESGSRDTRYAFAARIIGKPVADRREIVEIGWFEPADLPPDTAPVAQALVARAAGILESSSPIETPTPFGEITN